MTDRPPPTDPRSRPTPPSPAELARTVSGVVGGAVDTATKAASALPDLRRGRTRRRRWVGDDGRASIEVRTATRPERHELRSALTEAVQAVEGVHWAEVDGVLGRLIVEFEPGVVDPDDLEDVVETVEYDFGVHQERFSHGRAEHPGDGEVLRGARLALGADLVAAGLSALGTGLRAIPLAAHVGSVASLVQETPAVRHQLERMVGLIPTDVGLGVLGAFGTAVSQGPLGIGIDALHRWNQLVAADARRQAWERLHRDLITAPDDLRTTAIPRPDRPTPRPAGTVDQYGQRATAAALAAGATTLVATGSPRRATAMAAAGMPKPSRLGRETFLNRLQAVLAERDAVVMDAATLRHLDAVDCVVLSQRIVVTGRVRIDRLETAEVEERALTNRWLRRLFRPTHAEVVHRSGDWAAGPLDSLVTGAARRSAGFRDLVARCPGATHALCDGGRVVAVFTVSPEPDPVATALIESAVAAGFLVAMAGEDLRLARRMGSSSLLEPGAGLPDALRRLQGEGRVVAMVSDGDGVALAAADVGVGVRSPDRRVPWGADVICPDLDTARLLVSAAAVAHEVGRQGNAINLTGSAVGGLAVLTAPPRRAGGRAARAVHLATLTAMANGVRAARGLARPDVVEPADPPWHELGRRRVLADLDSADDGLTDEEASRRRVGVRRHPPAPVELVVTIGRELLNPLTPVLAGGALLSASVGSVADAALVGSVAGLNAVISGVQRFGAERAVRRLETNGVVEVSVRRDGHVVRRTAAELVPGDVVELVAGDTVPADCRVLTVAGAEVDEAALTGESAPVAKTSTASFGALVGDRTCMLYADTTVVAGSVTAVVVATGGRTAAARSESAAGPGSTGGVEGRLRDLSSVSLPVAGLSGAALAIAESVRGTPTAAALSSGVSLAVAAVPEGLPMLATIGQLSAARRLSERSVLVRNPRAVEALGRVEVLCVDKTGTLTDGRVAVGGIGDGVVVEPAGGLGRSARRVLAVAGRSAPIDRGTNGATHSTDLAVEALVAELGMPDDEAWSPQEELAFGPDHRYHAVWGTLDGARVLQVKGAPEELLERCRRWKPFQGRAVALTAARREGISRWLDDLAGDGQRVLAVAERRYGADEDLPEHPEDADLDRLTLIGFLCLADPVRPTAAAAVEGLRAAGVGVVMMTGDHPGTARAIAVELGLLEGPVVTGAELDELGDADLEALLDTTTVFARVTPRQKMRLVSAYQRAGRVVAMTGDGANDASAIRAADVGIALGAGCTPAARDAADVIIVDERIETLVEAIIEGRALWVSMRDAVSILLGGNLGEIGFLLATGGIGGRPSLNVRQVLLVNLLTDVAPALAIAARPPTDRSPEDLAAEGPDRSLGWTLHRDVLGRAITTSSAATAAWLLARSTGSARRASSVGLLTVVGTQLGQTIATGRGDPVVALAGLGSAAVLVGVVQTPVVSQFFGCTPVGPVGWSIALGCSLAGTVMAHRVDPLLERVVAASPQLGRALGAAPPDPDDEPAGDVIDLRTRQPVQRT